MDGYNFIARDQFNLSGTLGAEILLRRAVMRLVIVNKFFAQRHRRRFEFFTFLQVLFSHYPEIEHEGRSSFLKSNGVSPDEHDSHWMISDSPRVARHSTETK